MQLILYSVLISIVIFIIQIFFIIRKEKKTMKTIKNQSYFKFIIKIIVDKKIKSNMIWGSQYDAIMRWMYYNGIKVKETFEEEKNKTEITGKEEKDILNNIYDLSGCHYEWTIESCETTGRVLRRRTYALQLVSK